ncbi:hypothetical protein [Patulibacter sp.]|uniref:hypothetical protein n=1 Tax=Patulibacter sp. TaxID=1912859 RepID=UPI002723CB07|nr:hypothetical protein [Patulibacter sp.]MDO9409659.1 hypothetical protein [Patulibacter sp.]
MSTLPTSPTGTGSVSRLPARREPGAGPTGGEARTDAQRMERMIDAVQNLSRQLAETQLLLATFADQLEAAAEELVADGPTPVVAPRSARPAVGVPVRRAAPPAPVDPAAAPVPPAPLAEFVRAPGQEPPADPDPRTPAV